MRKAYLTGTALSLFLALPAAAETLSINPYPQVAPVAAAPSSSAPAPKVVVAGAQDEGGIETKLGKVYVPEPGSAYFDPPGTAPEVVPEEPSEAPMDIAAEPSPPEEIAPAKPMQIYSRPEALPHALPSPPPVQAKAPVPASAPASLAAMPPPEDDLEMSFSDLKEHRETERALKMPPMDELKPVLPPPTFEEPVPYTPTMAPGTLVPPSEEMAVAAPEEIMAPAPPMPEAIMIEPPVATAVHSMPEENMTPALASREVPWIRARKATPGELQQLAAMAPPPEKWAQNVRKMQPVQPWGVSEDGQIWQAREGANLQEVLWGWSQLTGTALVWDTPNSFSVLADASFSGGYEKAVEQLLSQHDDAQLRPLGKLYVNPQNAGRTLVITGAMIENASRN